MKHLVASVLIALSGTGAVCAQTFTTAQEVKPILEVIKANWIAVREFNGQDLLYFTTLMSYRCGMSEIRYATNGGEMQVWDNEPCYRDTAQPNAIRAETTVPYLSAPLKSIETIEIELIFDDGSSNSASFTRQQVQIN